MWGWRGPSSCSTSARMIAGKNGSWNQERGSMRWSCERGHILNTTAGSRHISGLVCFFLWVPFREQFSPSSIHTAFVSVVEQVPWLLCGHHHLGAFQLGFLQAHLRLWSAVCPARFLSGHCNYLILCCWLLSKHFRVCAFQSWKMTVVWPQFSQLTARGTRQVFCPFSLCS